jgi:hypothetical protein
VRRIITIAFLALLPTAQPTPAPVPVLVELFTAEGCSSCPPADQLLTILVKEQPIAGATVVGLGMHVDYWDRLGWKDPASLGEATSRQQGYSRVFGPDKLYTPQMVVDGASELVGSDARAAKQAIERAVKAPHARVTARGAIEGDTAAVGATIVNLPAETAKDPLDATLVITEDSLTSTVTRGENHGLTLHHDAVVRQMASLGRVTDGTELRQQVRLRPEWRRDHLNAIVFVQSRKTQRIWGAATTPLR